jgi:hypothetical protein
VVADIIGKIALAEGTGILRDAVAIFWNVGIKILLNLEASFHRQRGLGELVRTHASVRSRPAHLSS